MVIIKDNTPVTRADWERFLEDEQADRGTWQSYAQLEKGHGRLERRQITSSPDLNDYLRRDWGEVGQVFRLQRERTIKRDWNSALTWLKGQLKHDADTRGHSAS